MPAPSTLQLRQIILSNHFFGSLQKLSKLIFSRINSSQDSVHTGVFPAVLTNILKLKNWEVKHLLEFHYGLFLVFMKNTTKIPALVSKMREILWKYHNDKNNNNYIKNLVFSPRFLSSWHLPTTVPSSNSHAIFRPKFGGTFLKKKKKKLTITNQNLAHGGSFLTMVSQ